MKAPKYFIVEYEDGSTKKIEFNQLSRPVHLELSQKGLCPPPSEARELLNHYLLLHWKNGWQEVVGLTSDAKDLLRYYILERVEETGRMAIDVNGDYPVLLTIKRLPKELDRLAIVRKNHVKVYHLEPKVKREEGDKIEHVEFDKAEPHFTSDPDKQNRVWFEKVVETLRNELSRKGLSAKQLFNKDPSHWIKEYKDFAKVLGLRAMERQEDVYGFIQLLIEDLAVLDQ